jgi:hypothetical protein
MNPIVCPNSVEGIADRYALDGPVSKTGGGEIFRTRPEMPWGLPNFLHNGYLFFPGLNQPECGVNHPPPSEAEVKEIVEQYLYSPSGTSLSVMRRTQPFNICFNYRLHFLAFDVYCKTFVAYYHTFCYSLVQQIHKIIIHIFLKNLVKTE